MPQRSAGVLPVRLVEDRLEFFLVHPGGPFFRRKDDGAWSIVKGLIEPGEDPESAARRELTEELGVPAPPGQYLSLGRVAQTNKIVEAWAVAADIDPEIIVSNTFELVWPPRSGKRATFPEVDRAGWFDRETAWSKILTAQRPFLDRAEALRGALFPTD